MLYLIKIGGSLITDKTKPYQTLPKNIQSISKDIQYLIKNNTSLILGNGAGSFGHFSAKKFKTTQGFVDENSHIGLSTVQLDAAALHQILKKDLIQHNVATFSLAPSSLITTTNNQLASQNFTMVTQAMEQNMIPFLYGDVVLDQQQGCGVVSTDTLFEWLAIWLKNQGKEVTIVSAGDYDGVLDTNGVVIPRILQNETLGDIFYTNESRIDVTGGMELKVKTMQNLAKEYGIKSIILNGLVPKRLVNVLQQTDTNCTIIE